MFLASTNRCQTLLVLYMVFVCRRRDAIVLAGIVGYQWFSFVLLFNPTWVSGLKFATKQQFASLLPDVLQLEHFSAFADSSKLCRLACLKQFGFNCDVVKSVFCRDACFQLHLCSMKNYQYFCAWKSINYISSVKFECV